jgi:hypothetical protein
MDRDAQDSRLLRETADSELSTLVLRVSMISSNVPPLFMLQNRVGIQNPVLATGQWDSPVVRAFTALQGQLRFPPLVSWHNVMERIRTCIRGYGTVSKIHVTVACRPRTAIYVLQALLARH